MGYDKEKIKQIRGLMIFAVLLILAVRYSDVVFGAIALGGDILKPFLIGGVIAFILNLPMKVIEEKLLRGWTGKAADKARRPLSMLLSILVVVLIVNVVVATVVPQISQTLAELGRKIPVFFSDFGQRLEKLAAQYPELKTQAEVFEKLEINWKGIVDSAMGFLKSGVGSVLTSTVTVAGSIIGGTINGVVSFIFALYLLSQKEKLADQGRRIISAYFPEKAERQILRVLSMLYKNFSSFIVGQCLEAVILGTLFVVVMSLCGMPYAFMIGVLVAFTALIPIVGAFIGCAVGAFLILIEDPIMALWFVVLFLVLQQLEGNLIYPRVVGNSVGLPSIWVLVAVSLGSSLFGIAGILCFIPLFATGYVLLREDVNARNARKRAGRSVDKS